MAWSPSAHSCVLKRGVREPGPRAGVSWSSHPGQDIPPPNLFFMSSICFTKGTTQPFSGSRKCQNLTRANTNSVALADTVSSVTSVTELMCPPDLGNMEPKTSLKLRKEKSQEPENKRNEREAVTSRECLPWD